ncbi:Ig-like domain-containing protein (plasmid) [Vibrio sp. YMD68]|uniref:Ig-like domain-containing protein n=1 Tax=Vibrio sp. YMD68 TaxID=3042300 RepID=UPI00249AC747|nr:Ig-like domain-containing protein [Vibrio sp. YMD68]WGW01966.1 Ig-like domain-containing protein [Vibrio sp. YMD68]
MNKFKLRLPVLLGAMAAIAAPLAQAELLEYSFNTPDGAERTLSPSTVYANPTGNIKFALSAGIDRKVKISIVRPDGSVVNSATSHLLGGTDRITVNGKSYYGAELELAAPGEGEYSFKAEILSSDGESVQTDNYKVYVDLTAPTLSNVVVKGEWNRTLSDGTLLRGPNRFSGIEVDASDENGVESVIAYSIDSKGVKHGNASTELGDRVAQMNDWHTVFPNGEDVYTLNFVATDRAGNSYTLSYPIAWDSVGAKTGENPVPVAIYDPNNPAAGSYTVNGNSVTGYVPYSPGMTVYSDSYHALFAIPKTNDYGSTPYGVNEGGWCSRNCISSTVVVTDNDYVYKRTQDDIFTSDSQKTKAFGIYDWVMNSGGSYAVTVTPSSAVKIAPVVKNVEYLRSDDIWVYGDGAINQNSLNAFKKVKVEVDSRPYTQVVSGTWLSAVTIPPGQTVVEADIDISFSGRGCSWPGYGSQPEGVSELASTLLHKTFCYDLGSPEVISLVTKDNSTLVTHLREPDSFDGWGYGRWIISGNSSVAAVTAQGDEIPLERKAFERSTTHDWSMEYSSRKLPEGSYKGYVVTAIDGFGNTTRKEFFAPEYSFEIDQTPPSLNISVDSGASIKTLDDVIISLSDVVDSNPQITSIALVGGPANESVQLSWREESNGRFRLEYPVMFPSLAEGESYTLTVKAVDHQSNEATKAVEFDYKPREITLSGGFNGNMAIPAVPYEFTYADGKNIIETEPLTLSDGSVVTGSYDVMVTLRSDAQIPLVVNGIRVEPGQTADIMKNHSFASTGGRLSIPVRAVDGADAGTASLLVMTTAPNSPVLVANIKTWKASESLTANTWEVRQVIDNFNVQVSADSGVPCRYSTNLQEAQSSDPIKDPVCFVEWEQIPDEAEVVNSNRVAGISGQALQIGEQDVTYGVYLFNGEDKVKIGGGNRKLNVVSALGSVTYLPESDIAQVDRVIQNLNVQLRQTSGPSCILTMDAEKAKQDESGRVSEAAHRSCLFEWKEVPEGLLQDTRYDTPTLIGSLAEKATVPLSWRVSIFSRSGARVALADETFNIEVVDPAVPQVDLMTDYHFKDNIYIVPMTGDYFGDVQVNAKPSDLRVSISRNNETLESEVHSSGMGTAMKVNRRIRTDDRKLWEEVTYQVDSSYEKVPEIKSTKEYRLIAMPSKGIRPMLSMDGNTVLDIQTLNVKVDIRDLYRGNDEYDEATMGQWKVRLSRQISPGEIEPMSEWVDAENGSAEIAVEMSKVDSSYIRFTAEAKLVSPVEGYERIEASPSPIFATVLRGNKIDGEVTTRRLSGAAPFNAAFKLGIVDRLDYRSVGDVFWEVSNDDGQTWNEHATEERRKYSFVESFGVGKYLVRAKVVNVNSGLEKYTENVEIVSYEALEVDVPGPDTLLVGSSSEYSATIMDGENAFDASKAVIEWSEDGGKNYTTAAPRITLTREEPQRVKLIARVRSTMAPEDDAYAYSQAKKTVEFKAVKAPRIRIDGPRLVEKDFTYKLTADTRLPYRDLDAEVKGFFTLPDGTIIEGNTAEYVPNQADLDQARVEIKYTAWIDGYKESSTSETVYKARVWQYVWPEFALSYRANADVAPAIVSASVRPVGFRGKLEEPTYEWILPEGAKLKDQRDTSRSFEITEPGEHLVKVIVRDARGNEAEAQLAITIGQAESYKVELEYSGSNKLDREPLDVLVRPYIEGGHPRDRINVMQYTVNGKSLEDTGRYGRMTLEAGEHTINFRIKSDMGKEVEKELKIKVIENQAPVCSIEHRESTFAWLVYASCDDVDGRVKGFEWTLNGESVASSSRRLTISKRSYDAMPEVTLTGIDDAGGRSDPVTLQ